MARAHTTGASRIGRRITVSADWEIAPSAPESFRHALGDLHRLTAQVLYARGWRDPDEARAFFVGDAPTVDPFALKDMPQAVERILAAIQNRERIAIYADYDCDGVTAGALLVRTLRALGATVDIYIPDRFEEGYGVNAPALDRLKAGGASLVVTVDCGARALAEARHARAIGLDLIITDHHELEADIIPPALAMVDPMRPDCAYPFDRLAGVGVAFRLAQCVLRRAGAAGLPMGEVSEASLLDLVAIGTVADVVPLVGDNRRLVRAGLQRINHKPRLGLQALIRAAGLAPGTVDAAAIGFMLGPRLNAAGRLESALNAYELLMCDDRDRADVLAMALNRQNHKRQMLTAELVADAEGQVRGTRATDGPEAEMPALLFAASPHYNVGVIGLAAARLVEKYHRPAIVVSINGDEARGSCRSINGFDITQALDACRDVLLRHGGHAAAAGFTTRAAWLEELRDRLGAIVARSRPAAGWRRVIQADAAFALCELDERAFAELQQLEPHGAGNPRPVVVTRQVILRRAERMGKADDPSQPHLRLLVEDENGVAREIIAWRMGERAAELQPNTPLDIALRVEANHRNGERRMQLVALDFRRA